MERTWTPSLLLTNILLLLFYLFLIPSLPPSLPWHQGERKAKIAQPKTFPQGSRSGEGSNPPPDRPNLFTESTTPSSTPSSMPRERTLAASCEAQVAAASLPQPEKVPDASSSPSERYRYIRKRCREARCVLFVASSGAVRAKALNNAIRTKTNIPPEAVTPTLQFPRVVVVRARGEEQYNAFLRMKEIKVGRILYKIDTCKESSPLHE
ncbi:MAG: hypothetical protein DHS80DRAFT_22365 [Piptocephalis tieghemiana]|nr:MAG: hypothetical protein DHS80DRAFT_22365 [Piptocephalis tieghemiana]